MHSFDLVVIGGGPGGYVAAIRAAQLGLKVACVEVGPTLGGTCLNVGCIPSKALLHSSKLYHDCKHEYSKHGISCEPRLDLAKMMQNKADIVSGLTKGIEGLFKKNKVTHINGRASFVDKNTIDVQRDSSRETVTAKSFIIAVGSQVAGLSGVSIDEQSIVSSTGALSLKKIPGNMIVIGAGYIGLEMASVYNRLGTKVEVVEFLDKIVPSMDQEIAKIFKKTLEKQGIRFSLENKVVSAVVSKNDVCLKIEHVKTGESRTENVDVVLVAVGRKPNTQNIGLEKAGVSLDPRGFINVDGHLKTSIDNIYAIGDCVPGPMLAHKAEEEGIAASETIAGKAGHVNYNVIPSVVYTHPEVASVGQTEEQLKDALIEYNVGKFSFMANSRARAINDSEGMVKVLACKKTDKVLGAHIIGPEAGNLIHEIVVLMEFGGSSEDLARSCHAHPTLNEAVKEAALAVEGRQIHS